MKKRKSLEILLFGVLLLGVIVFYFNIKTPVSIPIGFTQFSNSKIPYTFYYPEDMNVAINYNNNNTPIVTVTSTHNPSYYYAITGDDTETMETHFSQINSDLLGELNTLTDGMVMQTTDFFDINTNIIEIGDLEVNFIEYVSKDTELTPFYSALYKTNDASNPDFTYVVFVSGSNSNINEVIVGSLKLK